MSVGASSQGLRGSKAASRENQSTQKCATIAIGHDFSPLFPTDKESFRSCLARRAARNSPASNLGSTRELERALASLGKRQHLDHRYDPSRSPRQSACSDLGRSGVCGREVSQLKNLCCVG